MSKISLNGNLILKPYKRQKEIETKQIVTGLSVTANKTGVEMLELLVDTPVNLGDNVTKNLGKGAKIYFRREVLDIAKWPRDIYEPSEDFPEGFVVGSIKDILYIKE
jgi:hypothetical protein